MFIRKKVNRSGKTSVQIIDKSSGDYRVVKTIGCSSEDAQIKAFVKSGKEEIIKLKKQLQFDFEFGNGENYFKKVFQSIHEIQPIGPDLLLGKLFDDIGFNAIKDELFRSLVINGWLTL